MAGVARPVVSRALWLRARKVALDLGVDASELAELGLRLVLARLTGAPDKAAEERLEELRERLAAAKAKPN